MTTWSLWIRAETKDEAAVKGREWAEAEPALSFERVASVTHREFYGVWTVEVIAPEKVTKQTTLGLE